MPNPNNNNKAPATVGEVALRIIHFMLDNTGPLRTIEFEKNIRENVSSLIGQLRIPVDPDSHGWLKISDMNSKIDDMLK